MVALTAAAVVVTAGIDLGLVTYAVVSGDAVRSPVARSAIAPSAVRKPAVAPPTKRAVRVESGRVSVTPRPTWVAATVATVWLKPGRTRPVDRPALRAHPRIARWISDQSLRQRNDLTDRVLTQGLHGEQLVLLGARPGWSKVRLPDQRGSYFRRGIIGWIPTRQLTHDKPTHHVLPGAMHEHRSGRAAVRLARGYLGIRYLWGGMSQRGIDCSGLTYRVYRQLGHVLPRDAADQSRLGKRVGRHHLRPGDLVFFGPGSWQTIHHVGIYAGHGRVLNAPHTGARVRITPLRAWPRSDYWGARRIL